jgi:hypothetical protein
MHNGIILGDIPGPPRGKHKPANVSNLFFCSSNTSHNVPASSFGRRKGNLLMEPGQTGQGYTSTAGSCASCEWLLAPAHRFVEPLYSLLATNSCRPLHETAEAWWTPTCSLSAHCPMLQSFNADKSRFIFLGRLAYCCDCAHHFPTRGSSRKDKCSLSLLANPSFNVAVDAEKRRLPLSDVEEFAGHLRLVS